MSDLISYSLLGWVTDTNLKTIFTSLIILIFITIVAVGVDFLIRRTIVHYINRSFWNSKFRILQLIESYQVLNSAALIISGLVFVFGSFFLAENNNPLSVDIATFTLKVANLFNLYILTLSINRIIFAIHDYYQETSEREDKVTWHSYIKIFSFFTWLGVIILAISYVFGQSPTAILTGLGALSAVFLVLFRDTFLGIIASIQANATSMVRIGDWITIDKLDIDGTIEDISINTVKIRNFDNTITTTPTYNLISNSVKNWEFMFETEARRFKHQILINPSSIKFVEGKDSETNLGLYRKHIQNYLQKNTQLNKEYQSQVKILNSTANGIPIEITGYSLATSGSKHEETKAQIIEFSLASLYQFELQPTASND